MPEIPEDEEPEPTRESLSAYDHVAALEEIVAGINGE